MIERVLTDFKNTLKTPRKTVCSTAITIIMLTLTAFAWDGIGKRLIICMGLSLLSGLLLLLPKLSNWISVPMLIVYLLYVPQKSFQRLELPMQDMSRLVDGAELLTVAFIICAYLLIFVLTQNSAAALGGGSGFFLILFLVEYYIWKFRGDFLMPSDLRAVGTAVTVMGSYDYGLSPEALYTVIYFLFFIVLGSRIRVRMCKWAHISVSIAAVLCIAGWYHVVMDTPNPLGKEFMIPYWNLGMSRSLNGTCMSYFLLLKDSELDVPDGYSEQALREIAAETSEKYGIPEKEWKTPNIIMIMNEAWSDPGTLGHLDVTDAYMSFTDSLTDDALRGNLYVSILGGLTANTEFEALTGNSMSFLASGVVPYGNQIRHDMPSMARVLSAQGYETMAVHPNGAVAWGRNRVYEHFGFDEFIHEGKWETPYEYLGGYISDACNFNEIIHRYEQRDKEKPFFLFNVTIQNHGSYMGEDIPMETGVLKVGNTSGDTLEQAEELQRYINLLRITDEEFGKLIAYFEQEEEEVIVCMFGDHQPIWKEDFYSAVFEGQKWNDREFSVQKHIVPYIIWSNYDTDWREYGDMSANYLPAVLMECAGLELPPFYQYLMELHREYPVLTKIGCLDKEGKLVDIADVWDEDLISRYRMFQYNQLYMKDYLEDIFVGTEKQDR